MNKLCLLVLRSNMLCARHAVAKCCVQVRHGNKHSVVQVGYGSHLRFFFFFFFFFLRGNGTLLPSRSNIRVSGLAPLTS